MRANALALLVLSGCGAAVSRPAVVDAPPPALPTSCTVRGVAPDVSLTVDALSFPIELTGSARYTISGAPEVAVSADGPLSLTAHAALGEVPLSLGAPLRMPGVGAIAETPISDVTVVDGAFVATIMVDMEVQVRAPLGCNLVALGAGVRPTSGGISGATHELVGDAPLPISATAEGPPVAVVIAPSGSMWNVTGRVGGRVHIVRELERGSIDAWVDAARLAAIESTGGRGYGYGTAVCGGCSISAGYGHRAGLAYEGPARLRPGATLRGDEGVAFARAIDPVDVYVIIEDGAENATLVRIDGITSYGEAELPEGITVVIAELALPPGALP